MFKVMSFNIRGSYHADGENKPLIQPEQSALSRLIPLEKDRSFFYTVQAANKDWRI